MSNDTLTIILAGDGGQTLFPLTEERAKAALPFGGKYRMIDFCLSNCLHSGLRRILVLTQYKSHSLQKHLRDGWSIFNPELGEYITPVPPQMRCGENWYQGSADAIYQNRYMLERSGARQVLILSAEHIYRMDYAALLACHAEQGADVTVVRPTPTEDTAKAAALMGVYVFTLQTLLDELDADHRRSDSSHDIARDILPRLQASHKPYTYHFGGEAGRVSCDRYWSDVADLDAYYRANMDLLEADPPLDLYQHDWPIRSYAAQSPPARTVPGRFGTEGIFINSIVAGGAVIAGGSVQHSILSDQVYVGDEAFVEDSILLQGVRVGEGARLRNCIIDKGVEVPPRESIGYDPEKDRQRFSVSAQGIVVVPAGYRFADKVCCSRTHRKQIVSN